MAKTPKRPRDPNQLAKLIVDLATGAMTEPPFPPPESQQQIAARKGGKSGGPARAKSLTKEQRTEIAQKAAKVRWHRDT